MSIEKISNNVAILSIRAPHGNVHLTLVWDEKNLVLIDSGFPMTFEAISEVVKEAGFSMEQISMIILTHQDFDHIGTVKEIMDVNPSVKVLAHSVEAPYIDGRKVPEKLAKLEANRENLNEQNKKFYQMLKEGFANIQFPITKELEHGDIIPVNGGIEVVFTPGHTPGHICLYIKECKTLVAGDSLNIADGHLTGANPNLCYDYHLAKESVKKMSGYDIETVITYHCGKYQGDIKNTLKKLAL